MVGESHPFEQRVDRSRASSNTRALKASQDSSRLKYGLSLWLIDERSCAGSRASNHNVVAKDVHHQVGRVPSPPCVPSSDLPGPWSSITQRPSSSRSVASGYLLEVFGIEPIGKPQDGRELGDSDALVAIAGA